MMPHHDIPTLTNGGGLLLALAVLAIIALTFGWLKGLLNARRPR